MKLLRILVFPLAILYGIITWLRNKLYDIGFFSSTSFDLPVISVGNLSVGGTGKTPHIEYLIRLLSKKNFIATLSRGYGRSSPGFIIATENSTSTEIGDEPLQFKKKFGDKVIVAVDRKRVHGIKKLIQLQPSPSVILLDDAFQHRAVTPSISIMLSDYSHIYLDDNMLPTGTLREFKSGVKRADIIVITKTPAGFSPLERKRLIKEIIPRPYQRIYFSYIAYGDPLPVNAANADTIELDKETSAVLITGIANPSPLEEHLSKKLKDLVTLRFPDHHEYSAADLEKLQKIFDNIAAGKKIILTTEKDAMRLSERLSGLPLFYIPIEVRFHDRDGEDFDKQILDHVRANSVHHRTHPEAGTLHS
jgi:tetraacyldisaccharide 4'-kinase